MEFIVRNYEEYEEAIKASKLLCAVFSADSEPSSVALSEAVRAGLGEELAGQCNFLYLSLSASGIASFALEKLEVASPGTVLLYRNGAKVAVLDHAVTAASLRPELEKLIRGGPNPPPPRSGPTTVLMPRPDLVCRVPPSAPFEAVFGDFGPCFW